MHLVMLSTSRDCPLEMCRWSQIHHKLAILNSLHKPWITAFYLITRDTTAVIKNVVAVGIDVMCNYQFQQGGHQPGGCRSRLRVSTRELLDLAVPFSIIPLIIHTQVFNERNARPPSRLPITGSIHARSG